MPAVLAPRLWAGHLLMVVLVVTAALLGLWQLDAWQTRRDAEARDLTGQAPVPLADVIGPDDPFPGTQVGQPVEMSGQWVPSGTVYVSGREHDGQDGYWMVTPLAIGEADASALPVVLGWVDDPADAPAPPEGAATLTGWLQPSEGSGAVDDDPGDDVLPQLRIADVVQHVDQDLYGAYVVAEDGVDGLPAGDLAALPQVGTFTALRNLLYGLEWFVFGAFAAFMWWRWVGEQTAPPAPEHDAADDDGDTGDGGTGADGETPGTGPSEATPEPAEAQDHPDTVKA